MAIYNGTQKVSMSGVEKIYVGTQLVYQNTPVLTSITLSGQTTSLNRGASFSFGGTVTAHYDNGSTANVTSSTTFSGYNMNTAGTYTVTARYTENGVTATATYSLKVTPIWVTIWTGNKKYSAQYTDPADWSVNIVKQNTYKFKITCSMYVKEYYNGAQYGAKATIYQKNPTNTLLNNGASSTWYAEYTLSSTTYTTSNISANSNPVYLFEIYGYSGTPTLTPSSTSSSIGVKLCFALKDSTNKPVFGIPYTSKASYTDAYIQITKVEQYY